jgi:hypothetical protein
VATNYVQEIRKYDSTALLKLWAAIQQGDELLEWEPGKAFEYLVLRAFELDGAEIVWPYEVELDSDIVEQIDGVIYYGGLSCLVEAKDRNDNIDIAPIAKQRNQLLRRPPSAIGVVFSRRGFTRPAKALARYTVPQTILLWEGEELSITLEKQQMCEGLKAKFRYAVEYGLPDLDLKEILS